MLESTSCCDPRFFLAFQGFMLKPFSQMCLFTQRHFTCQIAKYFSFGFLFVISFQELGELQEAKQLLIQQKLELQGQVEATQGALEQEQREHKATRDSRLQREEQLLTQNKEVQDKLVKSLIPTE